ncbi:MAG: hypothetical protein ACW981_02720 [Candidatus Hodarchaeales archaeon]
MCLVCFIFISQVGFVPYIGKILLFNQEFTQDNVQIRIGEKKSYMYTKYRENGQEEFSYIDTGSNDEEVLITLKKGTIVTMTVVNITTKQMWDLDDYLGDRVIINGKETFDSVAVREKEYYLGYPSGYRFLQTTAEKEQLEDYIRNS